MTAAPTSLKMWVRYVHDIFVVMKKEVEFFLNILNGKNKAIQFEMEGEVDGRLPFLDVMVTIVGNCLTTGVYKKGHTHRQATLLDYDNCHLIAQKRSVVKTLWLRAEKVFPTVENIMEEKNHLRKVIKDIGYPRAVVTRWTSRQENNAEGGRFPSTNKITVSYIKGPSEVTFRLLKKHGVSVEHKSMNTLHGILTKVKDKETEGDQVGIVYGIECRDCDAHYVGDTGKKLTTRVLEHRRAVGRKDKSSAIFRHCDDRQHEMDWQNAGVRYKAGGKGARLFLEAWASDHKSINRCVTLNALYEGLRERVEKRTL
ncbi:uncharacterized protein LOC143030029 [Oratosquilla oratoria]|uniref:uncharacterized protein LOC143030029 n=1 Tax=Oratosquilla oratoria TaxID=337810 RepID=UPI003F75CDB9